MPMITVEVEQASTAVRQDAHGVAGEAMRYFGASLAALTLDAALLFVGVQKFGMPTWLAGAAAYSAGLVLVYQLSIRWVFRHRAGRAARNGRSEFILFAMLGLVGLVLNSVTLYVATGVGLALPLAKMLSAAIGFVANFVSRKLLLFSIEQP